MENNKKYDDLKAEADDEKFLEKIVRYDVSAVFEWCNAIFSHHRRTAHINRADKGKHRIRMRIWQFTNSLPPPQGKKDPEDLDSSILALRIKVLLMGSGSELHGKFEQLKEENREYKEQVQIYNRAVSDMSFRHLLEMLPIAARAATGQPLKLKPLSGPDWETFWNDAWNKAVQKTDSPLHKVYNNSNQRRRNQIRDEGKSLYGRLSANMHDFGREYNPEKNQRDVIQACILTALKPENFSTDGDVDWDEERKRFI